MDISFDQIPGMMDLLARMERFTLDSPAREYLGICSDIDTVYDAIHAVLDPIDEEGEGKPAVAMLRRLYGTPAYLKFHAAAKELFAEDFFDGVKYVEQSIRFEHDRARWKQQCRGL
jgi:hypothetical protein